MEDDGYKQFHNLRQFLAILDSRTNRNADLRPKTARNSDLLSVVYGQPIKEFKQPSFNVVENVRFLRITLPLRKSFKTKFALKLLETAAFAT